jgi:hypothetical protein
MSHEIFGQRFNGYKEPAWHGLGTVFTEPMLATEVIEGLDYEVVTSPLIAAVQDGDDTVIVPTNMVNIMREPTDDDPEWRHFGTAHKDYGLVSNRRLAELLDPFTEEWPVETVGMLGKGERIFFCLDAGEFDVAGENCKQYIMVNNSHDGKGSLNVSQSGVRTVCWNTWQYAESNSTIMFKLSHHKNVEADTIDYLDKMSALRKAIATAQERAQLMGTTKADQEAVFKLINAAFPLPSKPQRLRVTERVISENPDHPATIAARSAVADLKEKHERALENAHNLRQAGLDVYVALGDKFPTIAGTVWHAFNAVTELSNWRDGVSSDHVTVDRAVVYGSRAEEMKRAYKVAVGLTK